MMDQDGWIVEDVNPIRSRYERTASKWGLLFVLLQVFLAVVALVIL